MVEQVYPQNTSLVLETSHSGVNLILQIKCCIQKLLRSWRLAHTKLFSNPRMLRFGANDAF